MNRYFKTLLFQLILPIKVFVFTLCMHTICFGQDSFEQIETDLKAVYEKAITQIKKGFPLIPDHEWKNIYETIRSVRLQTKKALLIDPNHSYSFIPTFDKNSKNYKNIYQKKNNPLLRDIKTGLSMLAGFACEKKKIFSLADFECCADFLISSRGVKRQKIGFEDHTARGCPLAWACSNTVLTWSLHNNKRVYDSLKVKFENEKQIIGINITNWNKSFSFFPKKIWALEIENTINHELTHLLEAHGTIHTVLKWIVKQYYPHENSETHFLFINLQKAEELMATVVPLMLSYADAVYHKTYKMNMSAPSVIHPSGADLYPWVTRIVNCYENYYKKT